MSFFKKISFFQYINLLGLVAISTISVAPAWAGLQIYVAPKKVVYPYPFDGTITVMGYLREVPAGTPVNISVSITLPDGTVTWLNPEMEFHVAQANVLTQFPFVAVPVAKLFETDGSKIFNAADEAYSGELPAGRYVMRSSLSGPGVSDSSEAVFYLAPEELLPSIAETPRPIVDSLNPPWGDSGMELTINGRNLRGMPGLVEPELIDQMQIKVTVAGEEVQIVDMDPAGSWIKVRLSPAPMNGDLVVNVTLPYWDVSEQPDQLRIPHVVTLSSNAFPFWAAPVITGIGGAEISPGATIEITGRNFSSVAAANQVLFNEIPGTVTDATETALTVRVPAINGTDRVVVHPVSNGIRGQGFAVRITTPSITRVAPGTVVPGDVLTVTGMGFSDNQDEVSVFLGGVPLEVQSMTSTTITAKVPSNMLHGSFRLEVVSRGTTANAPESVRVVPVW